MSPNQQAVIVAVVVLLLAAVGLVLSRQHLRGHCHDRDRRDQAAAVTRDARTAATHAPAAGAEASTGTRARARLTRVIGNARHPGRGRGVAVRHGGEA